MRHFKWQWCIVFVCQFSFQIRVAPWWGVSLFLLGVNEKYISSKRWDIVLGIWYPLWKIWSCFALQLFRLSFCSSSVGYNGSRICYINDEIVCFILGNTIKFIDIKTKEEQYILSPGDGIQSFAVNSSYECIAFSDEGAETNIFIYEYINLTTPVQKIPGMLKM